MYSILRKLKNERKQVPHRKTHHRRAGIASVLPVHPERKIRSQQTFDY